MAIYQREIEILKLCIRHMNSKRN